MKDFLVGHYYLLAVCLILCYIGVILIWYGRKLQAGEVVVVASLSAIAAVSRAVFFWAPQFKPMSAVILVSGSVFGPAPGMMIGILSGFLSNFIFGQGPWSPFQMLGFGLIGLIGGFLNTDRKWIAYLVGFLSVLCIYGPIVNLASLLLMNQTLSLRSFWIIELSGIPFDLIHAAATVVFLYFIWKPMRNKLMRLKTKYRFLQR